MKGWILYFHESVHEGLVPENNRVFAGNTHIYAKSHQFFECLRARILLGRHESFQVSKTATEAGRNGKGKGEGDGDDAVVFDFGSCVSKQDSKSHRTESEEMMNPGMNLESSS